MAEYLIRNDLTGAETWIAADGVTNALRLHEAARRGFDPANVAHWVPCHDGSVTFVSSSLGESSIRGLRECVERGATRGAGPADGAVRGVEVSL
jgi:hypothetical protein